jgi:hypothetical protein
MNRFQFLAATLALGGFCWGIFGLYFLLFGDASYALLIFAPGYIVTIGYFVRALTDLTTQSKVCIWGISMIVQGCWLAWGLFVVVHDGMRHVFFDLITIEWWLFSFTASTYAFFRDRQP